ncbi:MAG: CDP-glycerol glycerophosphotransferase family protein [Lachnospiraceae bacterium]|nr:CDP-glycerol glycerophosphotransferase family protein [Lachnospiraceae bacterium]
MKKKITVIYLAEESTENTLNELRKSGYPLQILKVCGGMPDQRNCAIGKALRKAEGAYITVVNEGDTFPENFLERINQISEHIPNELLISYNKKLDPSVLDSPLLSCEDGMYREDEQVNLKYDVSSFPVSLNGTFVPNCEKIISLWEDKGIESEKNFLLKILLLSMNYYRIGSKVYTYVNPADCHFELYQGVYYKEWYHEAVTDFMVPLLVCSEEKYGEVPRFLQYFTMYFMMCRLQANVDNRNKHVLEGEEAENYKDYFHRLLAYVDNSVLVCDKPEQKYYEKNVNLIRMFFQIKENDYSRDYDYLFNGNNLSLVYDGYVIYNTRSLRVNVMFIEYENQHWEMDLSVPSYFGRANYYVKLDKKLYPVKYSESYSLTKYFGQSAYKRINFHASVPIKQDAREQKLQFVMEYKGSYYIIAPEYKSHTSRLTGAAKYAYWRFDKFIAFHSKNTIYIRQSNPLYTAYREIRLLAQMISSKTPGVRKRALLRMAYHATKPIYGKKKIWMFYDKIYKGGDSAEYLYKYASRFDDGIDKYYLIDKNCPDRKRLEKEGYKPLIRGSFKHRLIFLYADMMIVSNSTVFAFNDQGMKMSAYIRDLAKFHVACVQHGMSVQKIAIAQKRLRDNTRLYFCASKYEIENLSHPVYDYVGYDALKLTGVPRYDGLVNNDQKIILISPTWRMQSAMLVTKNEGVARDYNPNFKNTDYFRVYNSLINDKRLIDAAKKYGYRINYVLHPIVSPQADDFDKNDYVDIIPATGDMSYEKIFCESSLMVTDFSGVQFDFAYMRKPLVYLHHKDIPQHYEEGTFHYDTMAFGEICHDNNELVDLLCEYMKNGCRMKDEYRRRADDFFAFNDHDNCKRIYEEMIKYQKKVDEVNKII